MATSPCADPTIRLRSGRNTPPLTQGLAAVAMIVPVVMTATTAGGDDGEMAAPAVDCSHPMTPISGTTAVSATIACRTSAMQKRDFMPARLHPPPGVVYADLGKDSAESVAFLVR